MSIIKSLSHILPPTERYYSARISQLEQRLTELETLCANQLEALGNLAAQNSALQNSLYHALNYANLEYAGLRQQGTILLAGWYGAENFGDELMMQTLIQSFPPESRQHLCVLLWDNVSYPRLNIDCSVRVVHYPQTTWELEQLIDSVEAVVWGGGAILDDRQFDDNPENYNTGNLFIRLSLLAIARSKPLYCLGLSTNDILSDLNYLRHLQAIIDKAHVFSIRDGYSLSALQESGIDCSRITLCNDIAFGSKALESISHSPRRSVGSPDVGVRIGIVCLSTEDLFDHYFHVINSLLEGPITIRIERITLVPFFNEQSADTQYLNRLKTKCTDSRRVEVSPYSETLESLAIFDCDFCICYKYHAALIANSAGIPTLNVYYDAHPHYKNKMKQVADIFSYQTHLVDSETLEQNPRELITQAVMDSLLPEKSHAPFEETSAWLNEICNDIICKTNKKRA